MYRSLSIWLTAVAALAQCILLAPRVLGCGITVVNRCDYPVTTCAQTSTEPIKQYNLRPNSLQFLDFGTSCKWPNAAIWASVKGQCALSDSPSAPNDRTLANIAEFTLSGSGYDYYDLSNVRAFTIPMRVNPVDPKLPRNGYQCGSPACIINDIPNFCRPGNQLVRHQTGASSCLNTDGPGTRPTQNTGMFKEACPLAYSYSADSQTSSFTCNSGTSYEVIFCPQPYYDATAEDEELVIATE